MMFCSSIHLPANDKSSFFIMDEYKAGLVWGLAPKGADIRKGCRRVNMMEIMCVCAKVEK
jgi:hypothetical protein